MKIILGVLLPLLSFASLCSANQQGGDGSGDNRHGGDGPGDHGHGDYDCPDKFHGHLPPPEAFKFKCPFEEQSYLFPQGYRHITGFYNDRCENEVIMFGGLGNGGPTPPTPMNHRVLRLDLDKPEDQRQWEVVNVDTVVPMPWFTSTKGFMELNGKYYLACDDSDLNSVFKFDTKTYKFTNLSTSTLGPTLNGGDCCAAAVEVDGDERIYLIGGRNDIESPFKYTRYYSITQNKWVRAADLNVGRSHTGCHAVNGKHGPLIYAIGGGNTPLGLSLKSIEILDVEANEWTLKDNYLPVGLTRLAVENLNDEYLLLIGGDLSCAGGGASRCPGDHPVDYVNVIDLKNNKLYIGDGWFPQLTSRRQTPGTAIVQLGKRRADKYALYVVGGRTIDDEGNLSVLATTEVLRFRLIGK